MATGSAALAADAGQSSVCAYMAWIALGGIVANATFHIAWADPVAAICLLPIVLREAQQAWNGQPCCA
jgi:divalent metal cation (Fe/Co/Zn/Cd) transporter